MLACSFTICLMRGTALIIIIIKKKMIGIAEGRGARIRPSVFHLVYRNISSSQPPTFLNLLFTAIKGNISNQNEGANILSFSYFQGYSNTKRSMQHSLNNLLATKGYTTAALIVLTSDVYATAASRDKRKQLLRIICSQGTPKSLEELRPFARKRLQIEVAINSSKVAY
ncbi:unnamed protein product [Colletotrichum noveboracense]|uniref:Uncharacterized protein n=1 Tax=Colletotrichum noveboracense TaxID=2664923 RepID=A0A9W4S811_9PEZI|nr:unnamed protein product [Colletotrichum noveboracense]